MTFSPYIFIYNKQAAQSLIVLMLIKSLIKLEPEIPCTATRVGPVGQLRSIYNKCKLIYLK